MLEIWDEKLAEYGEKITIFIFPNNSLNFFILIPLTYIFFLFLFSFCRNLFAGLCLNLRAHRPDPALSLRRKEEDGSRRVRCADFAADVKAALQGHHDVQDDEVLARVESLLRRTQPSES